MPLNADILMERAKLKGRLRRWRLIALVLLVVVLLTSLGQMSGVAVPGQAPMNEDYIARIDIKGLITADDEIVESLEDIAKNERIKAVFLHIDSPGGTAVGGEIYYEKLKAIQSKKPVIALMENMATSAGYLIAAPADRIYARRATITGSIGALVQVPDVSELSQKIGVDMDVIKTGDLKGEPNPFKEMTPESRAMLQGMVDDFLGVFTGIIAEHRKMPLEQVKMLADGRVFSGQQAVANKLVDDIGGEDEALNWLKEQKKIDKLKVYEVKLKKEVPELAKLLGATFFGDSLFLESFSLHGLLSIWRNGAI